MKLIQITSATQLILAQTKITISMLITALNLSDQALDESGNECMLLLAHYGNLHRLKATDKVLAARQELAEFIEPGLEIIHGLACPHISLAVWLPEAHRLIEWVDREDEEIESSIEHSLAAMRARMLFSRCDDFALASWAMGQLYQTVPEAVKRTAREGEEFMQANIRHFADATSYAQAFVDDFDPDLEQSNPELFATTRKHFLLLQHEEESAL